MPKRSKKILKTLPTKWNPLSKTPKKQIPKQYKEDNNENTLYKGMTSRPSTLENVRAFGTREGYKNGIIGTAQKP